MTITFEFTLQEGYSDQRGMRRETFQREASMLCVPRVGDTVETGYGHSSVSWVDWSPWDDSQVFILLNEAFTGSEPWDDALAAIRKEGWG